MPVCLSPDVEIAAETIGDLRALEDLPHRLEIVIPYRIENDTVIGVNRSNFDSEY